MEHPRGSPHLWKRPRVQLVSTPVNQNDPQLRHPCGGPRWKQNVDMAHAGPGTASDRKSEIFWILFGYTNKSCIWTKSSAKLHSITLLNHSLDKNGSLVGTIKLTLADESPRCFLGYARAMVSAGGLTLGGWDS